MVKREEVNSKSALFKGRMPILGTNLNFNTNALPFEVRGCKVILECAFSE